MENSILNISVSCFENYNTPGNPRPVNLIQWLTSSKYAAKVTDIRKIDHKAERDKIKATLPAITPSGLFSYRKESCLIKHSGLIQFDIDLKGNEGLNNFNNLKDEICKIKNVAYCGHSVSGNGFWGLIPICDSANHDRYFSFIEEWFKSKGLIIDTAPRSVASLRGYAYDSEGYFNHAAIPLKELYTESEQKVIPLQITNNREGNIFHYASLYAERKSGPFRDGNKHNYIVYLTCYLLSHGIGRNEAESWIHNNLLPINMIKSNCISYPYENYNKMKI